MGDDLVKRLHEGDAFERTVLAERAADRIEELEAKLATCEKYRDAYAEMERIGTEAYRDLEAKLSKMLEIVRSHDTGDMRREDMEVRRILARLEAVMKGEANGPTSEQV